MSLWSDDRAAAIQVGAIVLFAFVIIAITAYQASVVPGQNKEIEYNHNQRVQSQLQDVEGAIGSMPATRERRTVTVDLSTSYPARTIFINPPTPTGRLQTLGTTNDSVNFTVANATATNPDVDDFWDGTTRNYATGALTYQPNYNVYNQAPVTVVENSLVYNQFADATITSNTQSLFEGDRISLIALRGSLRENGGTASVNVRPVSASTTTVPVEADGSKNVTISIVSQLSPKDWNSSLAASDELANQSGYVANVSGDAVGSLDGKTVYRVNFTMVRGQTYDLQLARVGVGELSTGEQTTNASYALTVTDTVTTEENTNTTVTVEVRDQYDNPKAGVSVNASVDGSTGTIADSPGTTDEDGRVTFTYNTTDDISGASSETNTVQVSFSGDPADGTFDESAPENVTTEVTVKNTDGSGTGTGGGGGGAYGIEFDDGETYDWNVTEETTSITLVSSTTPEPLEGVSTDFAVNDSSIATIDSEDNQTNATGDADVTLNAQANGTVAVYVGSSGSSDVINVTVTDVGAGGGGSGLIASFTFTPSSPEVGNSVTFDASGSSDSDGTIQTYEWDWDGDGSYEESTSSETTSHTFDSAGDYDVTLRVTNDTSATDTTTNTVTVEPVTLITAVEPDPDQLPDDEGEFVRVYFPTSTDTTGWTIEDDDGQITSLPSETLSGEVYFARNASAFASQWGIDPARVYNLDTQLANDGDPLELRTGTGKVIDEFAYEQPGDTGVQTSNGWYIEVDAGEVAVRRTDASGNYIDTNESSDWEIKGESTFFGGGNVPPGLTSVTVENAPLTQADVGGNHTVTLRFNQTMDTSVAPTVGLGGLTSSTTYNDSLAASGTWVNDTAWEAGFTLADDNEEVISTIEVADAEDQFGTAMSTNTSNAVTVDTKEPTDITVDSNRESSNNTTTNVAISYTEGSTDTVSLTLLDGNGNSATFSNIDDSAYAGDNTEHNVTIDLGSPDSETGDGIKTGTNYSVELTATDAFTNSRTSVGPGTVNVTESQAGQISLTPNVQSSGNSGQYTFEIENNGTKNAEIVGIAINGTSLSISDAEKVSASDGDSGSLFLTDGAGTVVQTLEGGDISVEGPRVTLDTAVQVNTSETKTFKFDRFVASDGKNAKMKDESITVTFYFSDGSSQTITLTAA